MCPTFTRLVSGACIEKGTLLGYLVGVDEVLRAMKIGIHSIVPVGAITLYRGQPSYTCMVLMIEGVLD